MVENMLSGGGLFMAETVWKHLHDTSGTVRRLRDKGHHVYLQTDGTEFADADTGEDLPVTGEADLLVDVLVLDRPDDLPSTVTVGTVTFTRETGNRPWGVESVTVEWDEDTVDRLHELSGVLPGRRVRTYEFRVTYADEGTDEKLISVRSLSLDEAHLMANELLPSKPEPDTVELTDYGTPYLD